MPWIVLVVMLSGWAAACAGENLLANPGFESGAALPPEGWSAFWSRADGAGRLVLDEQVKRGGTRALKVIHEGAEDWSVAQRAPLPVEPGDIFTLGGWVKCESAATVQLSVVTRGADGKTIAWMHGLLETGGTHDWRELKGKFVVPAGCASIQFRLTGNGKSTAWLDDALLVKEGNVNAFRGNIKDQVLTLANDALAVRLETSHGTLAVTDKRTGGVWEQKPCGNEAVIKEARLASGTEAQLELWNVADDLLVQATLTLAPGKPELTVALNGEGALRQLFGFPQPFVTAPGTWLVAPLNEGILYPVDDETIAPMQLVTYGGHGICMPWFGVVAPNGPGVLAIIETPDDARIEIARLPGAGLFVRPLWEASRGQWAYARKLTYCFFDKGGYVAQAKRYCEYAHSTGLFKTLAQKKAENPNVDLLIGAANVWNWDMDKLALCRELKAAGMDRILWSNEAKPAEIEEINKLGFLSSRYDIYQDVWPAGGPKWLRTEGWPDDLVWLPNGDWMKGWAHHQKNKDGTTTVFAGGVICSPRGLERAKQKIPEDLKTHPYACRFIDTTTASPFRECYNPAHPLTRSEDRKYKMALLEFCSKDQKLVVGTETGIDPSVPYVHYYEGMMSLGPYRLPDAGRDMEQYKPPTPEFLKFQVGHFYRLPLWELVYHDCVVAQWYWGDSNNKAPEVWDRRDLFNILYGTPPMYLFNKEQWEKQKPRFVASYQSICPLVRKLGYDELLSHEFLTLDHAVQRTRWSSGTEVTVNFGDKPFATPDGKEVKALGWVASGGQK
ncbi:MAG: glycoside hydrolase [Planctomycetota bacterium]